MGETRFTIREVAGMTGLSPATLRKWEERYRIVSPTRLSNGYREYTQRDVALLRWVKARVEGGALVSTAADALRERLSARWNPLEDEPDAPAGEDRVAVLDRRLLAALLAKEASAAIKVLDTAFGSFSLETVLLRIIQPTLYEIGRRWELGEISEYQEHFSSILLRDRLSALRTLIVRGTGPLFVTACLPGEQHEIGVIILGLLAGRAGYRVLHLGASPSPEGLTRAVIDLKPAVLGLSVSNPDLLRSHADWLHEVSAIARRRAPGSVLVVGGLGLIEVTEPVGGFLPVHGDAGAALEQIRLLTRSRTPDLLSARWE